MPRPQRPADEPDAAERPPIWMAGRQQPRFALWPWLKVGTAMTRRWLAPRLDRGAASVKVLSHQIEDGRCKPRLGWLGKAQRYLPSRAAVTDSVAGFAACMAEARQLLHPRPEEPLPLAYPDLLRPPVVPRSMTPVPLVPVAVVAKPAPVLPLAEVAKPAPISDDDPAIQAIRAMMQEAVVPEPVVPARIMPLPKPLPAAARFLPIGPQEPMPLTLAMHIVAHLIAWPCLAVMLPLGLVRATLYHLNGGDLNDWD
jgi:hypothetical protein